MENLAEKKVSEFVKENYQTARVFEQYGLDFCCNGKRPLQQACLEKGIDINVVLDELCEVSNKEQATQNFNAMSLTELAEYIVRVHHTYVKVELPQISHYVLQVATKHGDRFPFMKEVYVLFSELREELTQHMVKEEQVLFPRIKLLELNAALNAPMGYLEAPIHVMEEEHERAGAIMRQIRALTDNYTVPENGCTTFRLSLDSLKAFEEDLHKHVHLENNILFPKSIELFELQEQVLS